MDGQTYHNSLKEFAKAADRVGAYEEHQDAFEAAAEVDDPHELGASTREELAETVWEITDTAAAYGSASSDLYQIAEDVKEDLKDDEDADLSFVEAEQEQNYEEAENALEVYEQGQAGVKILQAATGTQDEFKEIMGEARFVQSVTTDTGLTIDELVEELEEEQGDDYHTTFGAIAGKAEDKIDEDNSYFDILIVTALVLGMLRQAE